MLAENLRQIARKRAPTPICPRVLRRSPLAGDLT
jgi:hypothetical protein